jgi:hypothetical protein
MSGIGHADALLAPVQKFLAKMLFQRRKLLAQSRLGDMQDIGGARDAAGINDDDKGFEPPGVHCVAIDPIIFQAMVKACGGIVNVNMQYKHVLTEKFPDRFSKLSGL